MTSDQPVPRELKAVDTASLLRLEERAHDLGLSRRQDLEWVCTNAAPDGDHYLWPALWHDLFHRPDVPRQLRCELLLALSAGGHGLCLLDVLPEDFTPLRTVTSRDEGLPVSRLLDRARLIGDGALNGDVAP
ncbi:hypothetical protein [Actinomadura sp. NEAU-AAG7]|uniref:hypothetical protein n=1 Tax=Actinomadura sp. NEAU-AAG7 TaxID=2839640 RepID=UPI001BE4D895|nr:hypothetical protein [Actinomadura sp. NEAU-AAG7]MBT2208314.1 hypothetical protein [Actinomadura sp. NEAU-AAG7]